MCFRFFTNLFVLYFILFHIELAANETLNTTQDTAELFLKLSHSGEINSVDFSQDGKTLATGSFDKTIKLWDIDNGELLRTFIGHTNWVTCVTFSPDGKNLASASEDFTIKIWDSESGKLIKTLNKHQSVVTSVAIDSKNELLASGSWDKTIILWSLKGRNIYKIIKAHSAEVSSVAFSPDSKILASGSWDKTIKLWDIKSGKLLKILEGHSASVISVKFDLTGDILASASADNTIRIWDWKKGEVLTILNGHSKAVTNLSFSSDNTTIASSSWDKTVKIWNIKTGLLKRTLTGHNRYVSSVAFSPNGKILASGSWDNTVILYNLKKIRSQVRVLMGNSIWINSVVFSPDGNKFASASDDSRVALWDFEQKGKLIWIFNGHSKSVSSIAFSPDSKILASASADNTIKLIDVKSGRLIQSLNSRSDNVTSLDFSPKGESLASINSFGEIKIWDVIQGKLLKVFSGSGYGISSRPMSISYNDKDGTLTSAMTDNSIKTWDTISGTLLSTFKGHTKSVTSVQYSRDGQMLVSASRDKTIKLWDANTGILLRSFKGHTEWINVAIISPKGNILASASYDNTIKLWDIKSGNLIKTLNEHSNNVSCIDFSADGATLVSTGWDNTIKLWDIQNPTLTHSYLTITLLVGNQWLTYLPSKLYYDTSEKLDVDQYAAIRFNKKLRPIYPLSYYESELKKNNLSQALSLPTAKIKPKHFLLWWDNNKKELFWYSSGLVIIAFIILVIARVVIQRTDPMEITKIFFAQIYEKIEPISDNMLLLHPKVGKTKSLVSLWQKDQFDFESIKNLYQKIGGIKKIYLVYSGRGPTSETIQSFRKQLNCDIIPLLSSIMQKAIANENCQNILKELEERYLVRIDPYTESKPVNDPIWFYGREALLQRLPGVLAQGQHVGIFGLRKVGKTSVIKQITQRTIAIPTVEIDCQGLSAKAEIFFEEMIKQIHAELGSLKIKDLPGICDIKNLEDFRHQFLELFTRWQKSGRHEPFLIVLDEIDKLFPERELADSEMILKQYVRMFKTLRGMAQTNNCLVALVVAYRPDVNRYNRLTAQLGENPMYQSYKEEFLGFLNADDSKKMIIEIGRWRDIEWDEDAAERVFYFCGGHPLISRYFASQACEEGELKSINYQRVENTAKEIKKTFHRNEIGNYYKEAIWDLIREDERQVLTLVCQKGSVSDREIPAKLEDGKANLENFDLVKNENGNLRLTAKLFEDWVRWKIGIAKK